MFFYYCSLTSGLFDSSVSCAVDSQVAWILLRLGPCLLSTTLLRSFFFTRVEVGNYERGYTAFIDCKDDWLPHNNCNLQKQRQKIGFETGKRVERSSGNLRQTSYGLRGVRIEF